MSEESTENVDKSISANRLATVIASLDSHLNNFKSVIKQTYQQSDINDLEVLDEMVNNMEELSKNLDEVTNKLDVEDYYEEG